MSRIQNIETISADQNIASLYGAVEKKLGSVPNIFKALGNSSVGLRSYLSLSEIISSGKLKPSTREKIALLVAQLNACEYCLSAHTAIGGMLKISPEDLLAGRQGNSSDPKEQAILNLSKAILETKGAVADSVFENAKANGVTDEEAVEVVTSVALNIFTNYFNRFAQTENDFPAVQSLNA